MGVDTPAMSPGGFEELQPDDRSWTDHPLFHGLNDATLAAVAHHVTLRRYAQGATVFRQGDTAMHLFVIRIGAVEIRRELEGQDLLIGALKRGDIFGEMGLLTDYRRTASVV